MTRERERPLLKLTGIDPSRGRTSDCIAAIWDYDPVTEHAKLRDLINGECTSLPEIVGWISDLEEQEPSDYIGVDAINLGAGAIDYLQLEPFGERVHPFVASAKPALEWELPTDIQHKPHCLCTGCLVNKTNVNFKSRVAYEFRQAAYKGRVEVPDHDLLKRDLTGYILKKVGGKWKLEDPKVSPDYGDASLVGWAGTLYSGNFWIGR